MKKTILEQAIEAFDNKDYSTALELFTSLAEEGNAEAQFYLGLMYAIGWGVVQDYQEAEKWFRKSAEKGHANAQYNLGLMYYVGWGVVQDYQAAEKWYSQSAEQGYADAQYSLGLMYYNGEGIEQNFILSHMWLNIAGANGNEKSKTARDAVEKDMTSEDISQAQTLARKCMGSDYQDCGE